MTTAAPSPPTGEGSHRRPDGCALARYFILKKLHTPDRNLHISLMPAPLLYASLAEIFLDRKRKDFDPGQQDGSHFFLRVS